MTSTELAISALEQQKNSIATYVHECLDGFQKACDGLIKATPHIRNKLPLSSVSDELGRFKLWSGNAGAHRRGRASLDYKLREASHIRDRVVELLRNLSSVLEEATDIITGKRLPWEELSDSDSDLSDGEDADDPPTTELEQLNSNINEIVTCLMRLSVAIRNPAPHDHFKDSSNIDITHFETFDVEHVRGKFPRARDYLVMRLGKAVSRRRQYLRYREEHRKKFDQGLEGPKSEPQLPAASLPQGEINPPTILSKDFESTVASSLPLAIKTNTSIVEIDQNDYYEDTLSQTSYASSSHDSSRLRPPALPAAGEDGNPFECPLCFRFTTVRHIAAWYKHVYRDLQPYVCTFEYCEIPDRTFGSRHEWFHHEREAHGTSWQCIEGCNQRFWSEATIRAHLLKDHSDVATTDRVDDLVRNGERHDETATELECSLCLESVPSLAVLRRHLGKHHEELSLFALPSHMKDDHDHDDDSEGPRADEESVADSSDDGHQRITESNTVDVFKHEKFMIMETAEDGSVAPCCAMPNCGAVFDNDRWKADLSLHWLNVHKKRIHTCRDSNCLWVSRFQDSFLKHLVTHHPQLTHNEACLALKDHHAYYNRLLGFKKKTEGNTKSSDVPMYVLVGNHTISLEKLVEAVFSHGGFGAINHYGAFQALGHSLGLHASPGGDLTNDETRDLAGHCSSLLSSFETHLKEQFQDSHRELHEEGPFHLWSCCSCGFQRNSYDWEVCPFPCEHTRCSNCREVDDPFQGKKSESDLKSSQFVDQSEIEAPEIGSNARKYEPSGVQTKAHGSTVTIDPNTVEQDFSDEEIFGPNMFKKKAPDPKYPWDTAEDVFQDLQNKYNQPPVSQADFFMPKELLEDDRLPQVRDQSQEIFPAMTRRTESEDLPTIVIDQVASMPAEDHTGSSFTGQGLTSQGLTDPGPILVEVKGRLAAFTDVNLYEKVSTFHFHDDRIVFMVDSAPKFVIPYLMSTQHKAHDDTVTITGTVIVPGAEDKSYSDSIRFVTLQFRTADVASHVADLISDGVLRATSKDSRVEEVVAQEVPDTRLGGAHDILTDSSLLLESWRKRFPAFILDVDVRGLGPLLWRTDHASPLVDVGFFESVIIFRSLEFGRWFVRAGDTQSCRNIGSSVQLTVSSLHKVADPEPGRGKGRLLLTPEDPSQTDDMRSLVEFYVLHGSEVALADLSQVRAHAATLELACRTESSRDVKTIAEGIEDMLRDSAHSLAQPDRSSEDQSHPKASVGHTNNNTASTAVPNIQSSYDTRGISSMNALDQDPLSVAAASFDESFENLMAEENKTSESYNTYYEYILTPQIAQESEKAQLVQAISITNSLNIPLGRYFMFVYSTFIRFSFVSANVRQEWYLKYANIGRVEMRKASCFVDGRASTSLDSLSPNEGQRIWAVLTAWPETSHKQFARRLLKYVTDKGVEVIQSRRFHDDEAEPSRTSLEAMERSSGTSGGNDTDVVVPSPTISPGSLYSSSHPRPDNRIDESKMLHVEQDGSEDEYEGEQPHHQQKADRADAETIEHERDHGDFVIDDIESSVDELNHEVGSRPTVNKQRFWNERQKAYIEHWTKEYSTQDKDLVSNVAVEEEALSVAQEHQREETMAAQIRSVRKRDAQYREEMQAREETSERGNVQAQDQLSIQEQVGRLRPIRGGVPRYCFAEDVFWFMVECQLEDGRCWELQRLYQDFYDFQVKLIATYPVEAGTTGSGRTLPFMPGPVTYVTEQITQARRANLDEYVKTLLKMGLQITDGPVVKDFFAPRQGDHEIKPEEAAWSKSSTTNELVRDQAREREPEQAKSTMGSHETVAKSPSPTDDASKDVGTGSSQDEALAPKPSASAYVFFFNAHHQQVRDNNPGTTSGQLGRLLGEMWNGFSEEQRATYEAMAAADHTRHEQEQKKYNEIVSSRYAAHRVPSEPAITPGGRNEDIDGLTIATGPAELNTTPDFFEETESESGWEVPEPFVPTPRTCAHTRCSDCQEEDGYLWYCCQCNLGPYLSSLKDCDRGQRLVYHRGKHFPEVPTSNSYYGRRSRRVPTITQEDRLEQQSEHSARVTPSSAVRSRTKPDLVAEEAECFSEDEEYYDPNSHEVVVPAQKLTRRKSQGHARMPRIIAENPASTSREPDIYPRSTWEKLSREQQASYIALRKKQLLEHSTKEADETQLQQDMTPSNPLRISAAPTYAKIHRQYLDVETLHYYDIPYELSEDPEYMIVLREMSQRETEILFEHTRRLRWRHGSKLFIETETSEERSKKDVESIRKKNRRRSQ